MAIPKGVYLGKDIVWASGITVLPWMVTWNQFCEGVYIYCVFLSLIESVGQNYVSKLVSSMSLIRELPNTIDCYCNLLFFSYTSKDWNQFCEGVYIYLCFCH